MLQHQIVARAPGSSWQLAIVQGEVFKIAIVGVLLDENNFAGADRFQDAVGHGGFARPGTSANANYHPATPSRVPDKHLAADLRVA